jgi:hypothetical protein
VILIDTPLINVEDNQAARDEARRMIEASCKAGATFCMPHHASVEQLVYKNT